MYLEMVSLKRKYDAIDYINEYIENNSEMNGTGGLGKAIKNGISYENWLEEEIKFQEKEYAESKGKVPGATYFMIREEDNKIIGMVNFRYYLNDYLKKYGGHVGYGIRPSERRKGYAKTQLYLTLLEAQKLGIESIMVDCIDTNIGSKKTIQALGGVFSEEVYEENQKVKLHNYWINVNDSIEKYRPIYGSNVERRMK